MNDPDYDLTPNDIQDRLACGWRLEWSENDGCWVLQGKSIDIHLNSREAEAFIKR